MVFDHFCGHDNLLAGVGELYDFEVEKDEPLEIMGDHMDPSLRSGFHTKG